MSRANPGLVASEIVIKEQGLQSSPIKLTNAATHYEGKLEAIKLGTGFTIRNIRNNRNSFVYSDLLSAIQSIVGETQFGILPQHNYHRNKIKFNRIKLLYR